ncbi:hypothetical protein I3843_10G110300 [Carya illinoinensis]|uniref:LysM domain-containing protein n=1 Tax=Carya illinoinensis TaxID=32201 RepID=A0A8T1P6U2_CARIL|nr:hypothetical protein I3760_10G116100 [Carya illinoinensis]KAG6639679.1 hypothetical protein CIPAW_10G118000 [Carya illinoinensis]KAG6692496.1 hypothetical protein I3842_10G117300 [Carya illinoinensis]KAG7960181.1 hypothetical protein I3843_10G110300 [Carya illinoinensis]
MANSSNSTATSLNFVLMLSLLLFFSVAESQFFGEFLKPNPTPVCNSIYGVQTGYICFNIKQKFNLTDELFTSVNPNLNCTALFTGQWLCTKGALQ